jgi:zinc protease
VSRGARLGVLVAGLVAVTFGAAGPGEGESVRTRLPNGLTVLVNENDALPLVAASLFVRVGARWETDADAGITNVLQHLLLRGTTTRSALEIELAAERIGGEISASGDADFSEIRGTALARRWRDLLALITDVALHPSLAPDELAAERRQVLRAMRNRQDQASTLALDALMARLYGRHPYGASPLGRAPAIERLDGPALSAYHARYYRVGRMVLAVSGDVSRAEVVAEASRLFAGAPAGDGGPDAPRPVLSTTPGRDAISHGSAQAQVLMAFVAPPIGHPDYAVMKVLAASLGGGMGGRLFKDLREEQGLAYSIGALYPSRVDPSYLLLYAGTAPPNALRLEKEMRDEIERIRGDGVSPAELDRAKTYVLGQLALDRRTNARLAWYAAFFESTGVGYDFPHRFARAVEGASGGDVRRVARAYLAAPVVVNLGPSAR